MLPKKRRISRALFSELLKERNFVYSEHFTLRFSFPKEGSISKVGVSVSKKVSKSAVKRNSVRRRVYTAISKILPQTSQGLFLLIAKPGAEKLKGDVLMKEMVELFNKIRT